MTTKESQHYQCSSWIILQQSCHSPQGIIPRHTGQKLTITDPGRHILCNSVLLVPIPVRGASWRRAHCTSWGFPYWLVTMALRGLAASVPLWDPKCFLLQYIQVFVGNLTPSLWGPTVDCWKGLRLQVNWRLPSSFKNSSQVSYILKSSFILFNLKCWTISVQSQRRRRGGSRENLKLEKYPYQNLIVKGMDVPSPKTPKPKTILQRDCCCSAGRKLLWWILQLTFPNLPEKNAIITESLTQNVFSLGH